MTQLQVASLLNAVGLGVVLFVTAYVRSRFPNIAFKQWAWAYVSAFGIWSSEFVAMCCGRSPVLDGLEILLGTSAAWFLFMTGQALTDHPIPLRKVLLLFAGATGLGLGLLVAGQSFSVAGVPPLLLYTGAYLWLGWRLLRYGQVHPGSRSWIVGLPVFAFAVWMVSYPLLQGTAYFWAAFVFSGFLQLLVGVGLVVFLLEETTRQLQAQNAKLQQLDTLKSQILSTVGHELRTPLTGVKGFLELLDDELIGALTAEQHDCVKKALRNAEMLQELVESIMTSAQGQTSSLKVITSPVDLRQVINEVVGGMSPLLDAKKIRLEIAGIEDSAWAQADRLRLAQVLFNLLGNATKFSRDNSRIWLSVRQLEGAFRIEVRDEGIGIQPSLIDNIFDPFVQGDARNTREHGGVGLGLAICKNLVTAMGGEIYVQSEPNSGSKFWFTLPVADDSAIAINSSPGKHRTNPTASVQSPH